MSIIRGVMGTGGKPDDSELTPLGAILIFPMIFCSVYAITEWIDHWYVFLVLPVMGLVAVILCNIEKYCICLFERLKSK